MNPEKYYDEVIAPKLADIALDCQKNGLSIVFAVEVSPEVIAETRLMADGYTERIMGISKFIQMGYALHSLVMKVEHGR